jgi:hypothetical protein
LKPRPRWARRILVAGAAGVLLLGGLAFAGIDRLGLAPRTLAPYIEHRTSGHHPAVVAFGQHVEQVLLALDRGDAGAPVRIPATAGAQAQPAGQAGQAAPGVSVDTPDGLRAALREAAPGTVITLQPGTYRFDGRGIDVTRAGAAGTPIVVRAAQPGSVHLEFAMVEGFVVSAPYWRFENLDIHGTCSGDDDCEHAFHIVGGAHHFEGINNTISDFNAHYKINGSDGRFPDNGLIAHNTLTGTHVRATIKPVTPIDLVAASGWTMRENLITDFVKGDGNGVSYGAFVKGAGSHNVFERNVIWCEQKLRGQAGQRVGLSLGGGGTGHEFCRDGRCITEQDGGVVRANLVVGCSDVGIYLNSAAASQVVDNTLVDTAGIDVRYPTSSARIDGNIVDGRIVSRDGGVLHLGDNLATPLWRIYLGSHPTRGLFKAPLAGDFAWRGEAPLRADVDDVERPQGALDLCGKQRTAPQVYGAFADFSGCH